MVSELLYYKSGKGTITVKKIIVNVTCFGLYEGVTPENIINNLEFQGQPFSKAPIPTLYLGIKDYSDLAETYCIWVLLEAEPLNPKRVISSLAVCLVSNNWDDIESKIINFIPKIDYWKHSKDFDL